MIKWPILVTNKLWLNQSKLRAQQNLILWPQSSLLRKLDNQACRRRCRIWPRALAKTNTQKLSLSQRIKITWSLVIKIHRRYRPQKCKNQSNHQNPQIHLHNKNKKAKSLMFRQLLQVKMMKISKMSTMMTALRPCHSHTLIRLS